ncbi:MULTISPECIES: xanthine phosphoribosyltransferase [unclassified Gemella]|uniref:xanthine phosphoribosyltransferase n=1 Tax=unclassified Gemella TaxID=2624949 RepID=UPI001C053C4B|nr:MULTISPECIES: xanthine phosphoribosyltransferase [unclassified Gemella]MBU0279151.1 xanthine phosphoribosyltransferase [Gemella sp. zg-1178]QWQ38525.1 xanthine phosphoribosyltransferase [Gemella sp. zg-570]
MQLLQNMVKQDGKVYPNNVLKVDSFINHQIDPSLMIEMASALHNYFKEKNVTRVLTIEASGIAPAILVANLFNVPMVFAKKSLPSTLVRDSFYQAEVHSYTKNVTNNIIVSKDFLKKEDRVLIIDDFLAKGQAVLGLAKLVAQAEAQLVGAGILIEKSFQDGRKLLEEENIDVCSLCRLSSLENEEIKFNLADDEK